MQGKIVKGISGFYYVHVAESGIYECKAKGIFRNQKIKPLVGDNVEIAVLNEEEKIGNVEKILPRKNELIRPAVSNIDLALLIFAAVSPKPNFNLLDRFLIMMRYQGVPVTICFNKADIAAGEQLAELKEIYAGCGSRVLFTSAKKEEGIDLLREELRGKTAAVAGPSGVGKSSLINLLQPEASTRPDIPRSFRSSPGLILWTRRASVHCPFRDLKKKISLTVIRNLSRLRRIAVLRDAAISVSRTAG